MSIHLKSYAKVNLALDVLGQRDDGYHDIRTVFYQIDLADDIHMELTHSDGVALEVVEGDAPEGERNLAVRAAQIVRARSAMKDGLRIRMSKRIPMQAGLGGGSSNAAAALRGAADLCHYAGGLSQIAAALGSDVPFFLAGGAAVGEGRGELLTPLPWHVQLHFLIVKPRAGVSTAWAYAEIDRNPPAHREQHASRVEQAIRSGDRDGVVQALGNDFDPVVSEACPEVAGAKLRLLQSGAEAALLCGSGSSVMGVFPGRAEALSAAGRFGDLWCAVASGTGPSGCGPLEKYP